MLQRLTARRELGLMTAFVLVWSTGYLAGTIGARADAGLALVLWRFVVALAVLVTVSLVTRAPWPAGPRAWLHLLVTGALLQTVQLACVYLGLGRGVPAGVSAMIICACPLIVAAGAVPLFGERLTGRQWFGMALGMAGVVITLSGRLSGGAPWSGYALTVLGLAGFAAGTLYQKRFGAAADLRTGTAVQLLGAALTCLPLAAVHGGLGVPATGAALGSLAWLAVVNSIGGFTLLFLLLRARSGGAATSLLYLAPPVTALFAVPLLDQPIDAAVFVGMAVSGAGVLLITRRSGDRGRLEQRLEEPAGCVQGD